MPRAHLVIRGRVQGVGFRWYVQRSARALGLTGEVRNRRDGAVEVEAEGDREALRQLVELSREGPPASVVEAVEERWSDEPPRFGDFCIGRSS
jgi:acylphosphatase